MAKRGRKRKIVSNVKPPPEKQKKEEKEIVKEDSDSDIMIIESSSAMPCSPVVIKYHDEDNNGERLTEWCQANAIPLDYERILLGVHHCGNEQHNELATRTMLNYSKQFDIFDRLIWMHYKHNGQDSNIFARKMKVRDKLYEEFKNVFYEFKDNMKLWAVGSTVNGCGSYNSDMDLCLCLPTMTRNGLDYPNDKAKCLRDLKKVQRSLRNSPAMRKLVRRVEVIKAKVPIVKLDLHEPFADLDLDININNVAGVYNSHLIHYYSRCDVRFPAICLLVKHWAIKNDISDAMNGTFNSYSLILLVLHYLQCGVKPAVLPNLQQLFPNIFSEDVPLDNLELFRNLDGLPDRPPNTMKVGQLVMGFFHYYHFFDFKTYAISIRSGKYFPRDALVNNNPGYYIFVEEPFDLINTARCVTREECFEKIKREFRTASETLLHNLDLRAIKIDIK